MSEVCYSQRQLYKEEALLWYRENPGPGKHHVDPSKTIEAPYIVKGMLLYLDKMEGNNVFQWGYVH